MKVMLVNGSPHAKGNTFLALDEMRKVFEQEGIQAEIVQVGSKAVRGFLFNEFGYQQKPTQTSKRVGNGELFQADEDGEVFRAD